MTHIVCILLALELHKAISLMLARDSVLGEVDIDCRSHSTMKIVKLTMPRNARIAEGHVVGMHRLANSAFFAVCPKVLRYHIRSWSF